MSLVQLALKIELEQKRSMTIYEMLGRFGDRLPKDVQQEMRTEAEESSKKAEKLLIKL